MDSSAFPDALQRAGLSPLTAQQVSWLQVNVGKLCNQACHHCHVDAGPNRLEIMSPETAEQIIRLLEASPEIELVDLTGGAPELNPSFRRLVAAVRAMGVRVIDRCNLTVLFEPNQEDLVQFLASHQVEVVASLPCYLHDNVDKQRGSGVFDLSIAGLRSLNEVGYGREGSGLLLDLVYNPVGAHLPPAQDSLQETYKHELMGRFGIQFNKLITITNMPISRFRHGLERDGLLDGYEQLLLSSFNPSTVSGLMCRSLISIGWDGALYDCDFNQMLDMELESSLDCAHLDDIEAFAQLGQRPIRTGTHCFGCTAGTGSGCGGAIA